MNNKKVRIGTRGSQLALYQAEKVKATIENKFPEIDAELVIIHSKGDKILDVALSKIGDKGLFTKELEEAMFRGEVDMAVHSLKDLPTTLPDGLQVGGVLKRAEVRDALVSVKGLKMADLKPGMKIATSSLRRKAQLLKINPDFTIVDIRGNVNTRLRKMEEGYCDVMIMAAAGLQRIGLERYITEIIDADYIIPAVSQGAIAIETKIDDRPVNEIIESITDSLTLKTTNAERVFLRKLEGGCQIPIGCYTKVNHTKFEIKGFMAFTDGTNVLEHTESGELKNAEQIASNLADYFISQGSRDLLERIRKENES